LNCKGRSASCSKLIATTVENLPFGALFGKLYLLFCQSLTGADALRTGFPGSARFSQPDESLCNPEFAVARRPRMGKWESLMTNRIHAK
jgi:hypothetical protein